MLKSDGSCTCKCAETCGKGEKKSKEMTVSVNPCCLDLYKCNEEGYSTFDIFNRNSYPVYFKLVQTNQKALRFQPQDGKLEPYSKITVVGYHATPGKVIGREQKVSVIMSRMPLDHFPENQCSSVKSYRTTLQTKINDSKLDHSFAYITERKLSITCHCEECSASRTTDSKPEVVERKESVEDIQRKDTKRSYDESIQVSSKRKDSDKQSRESEPTELQKSSNEEYFFPEIPRYELRKIPNMERNAILNSVYKGNSKKEKPKIKTFVYPQPYPTEQKQKTLANIANYAYGQTTDYDKKKEIFKQKLPTKSEKDDLGEMKTKEKRQSDIQVSGKQLTSSYIKTCTCDQSPEKALHYTQVESLKGEKKEDLGSSDAESITSNDSDVSSHGTVVKLKEVENKQRKFWQKKLQQLPSTPSSISLANKLLWQWRNELKIKYYEKLTNHCQEILSVSRHNFLLLAIVIGILIGIVGGFLICDYKDNKTSRIIWRFPCLIESFNRR